MDHTGHRERLRDRFCRSGLEALADHEKLELLLTYAIPRKDTKPAAYALINRFGSLHAVLQADTEDLIHVEGIGPSAAVLISMMLPLFRAYRMSAEKETHCIRDTRQAVCCCEALLEGETVEKFYVICLNASLEKINTVLIAQGDVTEVRVYMRHLVSALTQCGAACAIIAHNHPGGIPQPSEADIRLTQNIETVLGGMEIRLLDHIIVGAKGSFSFQRAGLMKRTSGDGKEKSASAGQDIFFADNMTYMLSDDVQIMEKDACREKQSGRSPQ